jgi:hypothetical protein
MRAHLGSMYVVVHLRKPSIHNLAVAGAIEVPGLGRLKPFTLGGSRFRAATNSPKSGLPILRSTSNYSWVNRTELLCSSSLSGSSWSSRGMGSSSPIDSGGATWSLAGFSGMASSACFRFFLGAIRTQEVSFTTCSDTTSRTPKSRGETHLRVSQSQVAES